MRSAVLLALVACVARTDAYPSMAGSCEGVFSGNHVRMGESGKKRGDGGWGMQVPPSPALFPLCVETPLRAALLLIAWRGVEEIKG